VIASKAVTESDPMTRLLDAGLVDPATLQPLCRSEDGASLVAPDGRSFPIIGGIPDLVPGSALPTVED
jgi:uncharacterized protein YbaR (Trm112 family)